MYMLAENKKLRQVGVVTLHAPRQMDSANGQIVTNEHGRRDRS